jgi:iron complex outermembrane receptor protein
VNPVKALDLIPSVNGQNADPYGMAANQPPSNQAVRIRGESASSSGTPGSIRTIEGIPLTGAPGGGASILDLENSDGLTIYRGAIPPNRGLGWANIAGNLDIAMLKPAEKFGLFAKQSYGSFDFNRTFARIDSGRLATDTPIIRFVFPIRQQKNGGAKAMRRIIATMQSLALRRNFLIRSNWKFMVSITILHRMITAR